MRRFLSTVELLSVFTSSNFFKIVFIASIRLVGVSRAIQTPQNLFSTRRKNSTILFFPENIAVIEKGRHPKIGKTGIVE